MRRFVVVLMLLSLLASVHAVTDDERLAQLSGAVLNLTTSDFQLACGPANEIILGPTSKTLVGNAYCLHVSGSTITYGTFIDAKNVPGAMLEVATDPRFGAHIKPGDVKTDACNQKGIGKWELCSGAIKGMYTYTLDDTLRSETVYLIVSTKPQDALAERGIMTKVVDFFKGWFG